MVLKISDIIQLCKFAFCLMVLKIPDIIYLVELKNNCEISDQISSYCLNIFYSLHCRLKFVQHIIKQNGDRT